MGEDNEEFRTQLTLLAEVVELLEKSFINKDYTDIKISIDEDKFNYLSLNLNNNSKDRIIINISNYNFIFLKK